MATDGSLNLTGGLTENKRDTNRSKLYYTENVFFRDGLARQTVNDNTVNSSGYSTSVGIHKLLQVGSQIYGMGQNNTSDKYRSVYVKTVGTSNNWSVVTNTTSATNTLQKFLEVKDGYVYYNGDGNYIGRYQIGGSATNNWLSFNGGGDGSIVWQGNMYVYQQGSTAARGEIFLINTSSPGSTSMKLIPAGYSIVQLVNMGEYIGIFLNSLNSGKSLFLLWDGVDVADNSFQGIFEIAKGSLSGGALNSDGTLYAINCSAGGKSIEIYAFRENGFRLIYTYNARFTVSNLRLISPFTDVKSSAGYVYFGVTTNRTTSDTVRAPQIMRFGRENIDSPNTLSVYKTFYTGASSVSYGDFVVFSQTNSQQQENVIAMVCDTASANNQTDYHELTTSTYSSTEQGGTSYVSSGVLETTILTSPSPLETQYVKKITVFTEPKLSGETTVIKIMSDSATSWTTVSTDATVGASAHVATLIESTGANLPVCRELRIRIEFYGNAKVVGYMVDTERIQEEDKTYSA